MRRSAGCALVVALGTVSPLAAAQPPPFVPNTGFSDTAFQPTPAVDAQGHILLAMTRRAQGQADTVVAIRVDGSGATVAGPATWGTGLSLDAAGLAAGYLALRGDATNGAQWSQRLAIRGEAFGSPRPLGILQFLQMRTDPRGGAVAFGRGPDGVVGVRYAADGTVPGEPFVLEQGAQRFDTGIDARGNIVLVSNDAANRLGVRRYSAARKPLGPRFDLGLSRVDAFRVAVFPDGRFVVLYLKPPQLRVWARAFRANGTPVGAPIAVSSGAAAVGDGLTVAVDTDSSLLVVWKGRENGNDAIQGRFVAASGAPIGAQIAIGGPQPATGPPEARFTPRAVRTAPGDYLVFWVRAGQAPGVSHLRGQRILRAGV